MAQFNDLQHPAKRKSLLVRKRQYMELLESNLPHECYLNAFNATQRPFSLISDGPTVHDITITHTALKIDLPFPICTPNVTHGLQDDKCTDMLRKKEQYDNKINHCRRNFKADKKLLTKAYIKESDLITLPKYIFDLTTGAIQDEDPRFDPYYDFLYTGGDLCKIMLNDSLHLMRPTCPEKICITNIKNPKKFYYMNVNNKPIYNIQSYSNIVTVRQKHKAFLLDVQLEDELKVTHLFECKSKRVPYLDVKWCESNEIGTLDATHNLLVTDVEYNKNRLNHTFSSNDKYSLAQFNYLNDNSLLFMNSFDINLIDKRSFAIKTKILKTGYLECNDLCTFTISPYDNNYIYIVSKHNIIKMDLRELQIVKTWTHLLAKTPTVCKVAVHDKTEYLCLSSFNEQILLQIDNYNNYMPLYVPNMMETLNKCNLTQRFNLNRDAAKRFGFSISGMEIIQTKPNEHVSIFTSNSIGDIFRNNINTNQTNENKPLHKLNAWIDLLPTSVHPIKATSFQEMSDIKYLLTRPIKDKKLVDMVSENPLRSKLLDSLEELQTNHFATIWNDKIEIDDDDNLPRPITPTNKVSNWLQNTFDNIDHVQDSFDATKYEYDVDDAF